MQVFLTYPQPSQDQFPGSQTAMDCVSRLPVILICANPQERTMVLYNLTNNSIDNEAMSLISNRFFFRSSQWQSSLVSAVWYASLFRSHYAYNKRMECITIIIQGF